MDCIVHGVGCKEVDMTEQLSLSQVIIRKLRTQNPRDW